MNELENLEYLDPLDPFVDMGTKIVNAQQKMNKPIEKEKEKENECRKRKSSN